MIIVFIGILLTSVHGQIVYFRTSTNSQSNVNYRYLSLTINQDIIMFATVPRSNKLTAWVLNPPPYTPKTPIYHPLILSSSEKIRSRKDSKFKGYIYFHIFNLSSIRKYNWDSGSTTILPPLTILSGLTTNEVIVDCLFGSTFDETIVLLKNITSTSYQLLFFVNGTKTNFVNTIYSSSQAYLSLQATNGNIHILFQSGVAVYSQNSQLLNIKNIIFPVISNTVSMTANDSFLCYSYGSTVFILSTIQNAYTIIDSYDIGQQITDIKVQYPYLFVSAMKKVYQYDLDIKATIHTLQLTVFNSSGFRFAFHRHCYLIFYNTDEINNIFLYVYLFNNRTNCGGQCTKCPKTYVLNKSDNYCVKNYTQVEQEWPGEEYQPIVNNFISFFGKSISFSSFRVSPKQFVSLATLFDQLQPYTLHRNNYPNQLKFFMIKSSLINDIKLSAWMLQFVEQINTYSIAVQQNARYSSFLSSNPNNPEKVYLLSSTQPVYRSFLLSVILVFTAMKLLQLVAYLLRKKHWIIHKIYNYLSLRTTFYCLIISVLQPNVSNLSMCCFLQLKLFFAFGIFNKMVLVTCALVLYIVIMYTIAFYPLSFALAKKNTAMHLLIRSNHKLRSYLSEGFYFLNRAVVKIFVHTFLVQNYKAQMLCLILVDLTSIYIVIHYRRQYLNFLVFILFVIYHTSFLCLNFTLYIGTLFESVLSIQAYRISNFSFLLSALFSSLAIFIILFVKSIISVLKNKKCCRKQNVIQSQIDKQKSIDQQFNFVAKNLEKPQMLKINLYQDTKQTAVAVNEKCQNISLQNNVTKQKIKQKIQIKKVKQSDTVIFEEKQISNKADIRKYAKQKSKKKAKIKKAKIKKFHSQNKSFARRQIRFQSKKYSVKIARNYHQKNQQNQQEDDQ